MGISGLTHAASTPALRRFAFRVATHAQGWLPAGWLAFTGRASNPLDHCERFQITWSSPFPVLLTLHSCPCTGAIDLQPQSGNTLDRVRATGPPPAVRRARTPAYIKALRRWVESLGRGRAPPRASQGAQTVTPASFRLVPLPRQNTRTRSCTRGPDVGFDHLRTLQ